MTPVWNRDSVRRALAQARATRADLLDDVRALVVGYTGWNGSRRACDILFGDWIDSYVQVALAASTVGDHTPAHGALNSPASHLPDQFKQSAMHDPGVYTTLDRLLKQPDHRPPIVQPPAPAGAGRASLAQRVFAGARNAPVLITHPYYRCSGLRWGAGVIQLGRQVVWNDFTAALPITSPYDVDARARAVAAACLNGVEPVRQLMPWYLPTAFLENLNGMRAAAHTATPRRPKVVYTALGLHASLAMKLLLADWIDSGTRLLAHQHGGGYGLDAEHSHEHYERGVSDQFYSWGWTTPGGVRPLTPAVSAPPTRRLGASGVLLCCVDYPRLPYRLHYQPMPGSIETLHTRSLDFVRTFAPRDALTIRPYPLEFGWGFSARLKEAGAGAVFDLGSRASESFAAAELVVHNYLGTAWLETIAADIPTVCFFDEAAYAFRDDAAPHIEALLRVGVLHRTGEDAARFVTTLRGGSQQWWHSPEVRAALEPFIRSYARFETDWPRRWRREFDSQVVLAH
jgi:hypothetical protein